MASSIETHYLAVKTAYEAALPVPQQGVIKWRFGDKYVHENTNWPRIVLVHATSEYTPLTRSGNRPLSGSETRNRYLRRASIQWYVWGASKELAEAMVTNLVVIQRRVLGGSESTYSPGSEEWPGATTLDVADGGSAVVLTSIICHEISDEVIALPAIELANQEHSAEFNGETVC